MAALSTQSAGLVRQKAYNAVYGTGTGTSSDSVSPYHFYAVKALFLHLAANKGNPDLQFLPYAAEDAVVDGGGTTLVTGALTLYAWFGKARRTSGTTASYEALYDISNTGATGDSDIIGDDITVQKIKATGQQFFCVHPDGWAVATGLAVNSTTAIDGATQSSAANSTDGFVIVGA
jgi:hypothetical protein